MKSSYQCFQRKFTIKVLLLQSSHGLFLKMFLMDKSCWIDVNVLFEHDFTPIALRTHVPSLNQFSPCTGFEILICYRLNCDSVTLNCLYILLFMLIDYELMMNDPWGSMYEHLSMNSLCFYVLQWISIIGIVYDFYYAKNHCRYFL